MSTVTHQLHFATDEVRGVRQRDSDRAGEASQREVGELLMRVVLVHVEEGLQNVEGGHFKRDVRRNTLINQS